MIEMRAAPDRREEFLALCKEGVPRALRAGCLQADILTDAGDSDVVVLVERWPTAEAFRAFAATEWADAHLLARYRQLAAGEPRLRQFEVVPQP